MKGQVGLLGFPVTARRGGDDIKTWRMLTLDLKDAYPKGNISPFG